MYKRQLTHDTVVTIVHFNKNRKLRINFGRERRHPEREGSLRCSPWSSYKSPPLSVPVSPSSVSREASRDFVALNMWLHARYQISKTNVWCHIVHLVYILFWVWIGWAGYNFYVLGSEPSNYKQLPKIRIFSAQKLILCPRRFICKRWT